jgi:hypothetical protein
LETAASALKSAAAASETPAERNERSWKNYEPVTQSMLTKAAIRNLLLPAFSQGTSSTRATAAVHNFYAAAPRGNLRMPQAVTIKNKNVKLFPLPARP